MLWVIFHAEKDEKIGPLYQKYRIFSHFVEV